MIFLSRFTISFLLFCLLWIALVIMQMENPTKLTRWINEAYKIKDSRAVGVKTNKIIVVSGSNTLFGIDSESLEDYFHRPVVNGAVNAGLGARYIFYRSKKVLKKGDIAILPLEYRHYQEGQQPTNVLTSHLLSYDKEGFLSLPWSDQFKIISGLSFSRLYEGYMNQDLRSTADVNGLQNINVYGDRINNESSNMRESHHLKIKNLSARRMRNAELDSSFLEVMDEYLKWAKTEGVCVIIMPPTFMYFEEYRKKPYPDFFSNIRTYFTSRDINFVGNPYSYMYEKKYYFDTAYHLNASGVQKRTQQMMNDLGQDISRHCKNT